MKNHRLVGFLSLGLVAVPPLAWLAWHAGGRPRADILDEAPGPEIAHIELTGPPLFFFGDLYLDGRSAWLRNRFELDRGALLALTPPPEPTIEVRVHRAPFTGGAWLSHLDDGNREHRRDLESQTVETEIVCYFPDVRAEALAVTICCSGAISKIPDEGGIDWSAFYPPISHPPERLSPIPELASHQYLTREIFHHRGRPLAQPTDVVFLNDLRRDEGGCRRVYQAWRNLGDPTHGVVRLAAGQFAMIQRAGGTLLHVRSYFSGQGIPAFAEPLVRSVTRRFYEKLLRWYRENVSRWSPPSGARVWIDGLGWE